MMMIEAWQKLLIEEPSIQDQKLIIASPVNSSAYSLYAKIKNPLLDHIDLDINDSKALAKFIEEQKPAAIGFEIESISAKGLRTAQAVMPSVKILEIIQDKGKQKQWYEEHGIKTAGFQLFNSIEELRENSVELPLVIKTRTDGYDGRGVAIISEQQDLDSLVMPGKLLSEKLIDIATELAIIVVRNKAGKLVTYPSVEMSFDSKNQLEALVSPTINIPDSINNEAQKLAEKIAQELELEGILAIEFLYSQTGELYVNEMAPRTHNSGHHSIEAYNCSQFEQYLRVLFALDLKTIETNSKAAAIYNIVGIVDFEGAAELDKSSLTKHDSNTVFFHWYQKSNKNNRKLGHLTVLATSPQEALDQARRLGSQLRIKPRVMKDTLKTK